MAVTQGVKLDESTSRRLKALAQQRKRSAHWLMRDAIDRYLSEEEQYEREKAEDMAEYEEYLLTGKAISNGPVAVWLNKLAYGNNAPWPKQK